MKLFFSPKNKFEKADRQAGWQTGGQADRAGQNVSPGWPVAVANEQALKLHSGNMSESEPRVNSSVEHFISFLLFFWHYINFSD